MSMQTSIHVSGYILGMYIYIYIHTLVYIHTYIYISIYKSIIYIYISIYIHISMSTHTYIYTCILSLLSVYICGNQQTILFWVWLQVTSQVIGKTAPAMLEGHLYRIGDVADILPRGHDQSPQLWCHPRLVWSLRCWVRCDNLWPQLSQLQQFSRLYEYDESIWNHKSHGI